jgi:hypothetical protein
MSDAELLAILDNIERLWLEELAASRADAASGAGSREER